MPHRDLKCIGPQDVLRSLHFLRCTKMKIDSFACCVNLERAILYRLLLEIASTMTSLLSMSYLMSLPPAQCQNN